MHTDLHAPRTCDRKGLHTRVDSTDMDQQKLRIFFVKFRGKERGDLLVLFLCLKKQLTWWMLALVTMILMQNVGW